MSDLFDNNPVIATSDKNGNIIGALDSNYAHSKGVLHKGISVILQYKESYVLQHRKSYLFNGSFDLSCSSHPIYKRGKLEKDEDVAWRMLKKQWKISKTGTFGRLTNIGFLYCRAKDDKSKFIEHEMREVFVIK